VRVVSRKWRHLVAAGLCLAVLPVAASAQEEKRPLEEPRLSREQIEEEMRLKEKELNDIRRELQSKRQAAEEIAGRERDLMGEVERINDEIRVNRDLLTKLQQQKDVIITDLEMTNQDLMIAEASYEMASDMLGKRLRAIYKFGRGQVMEVLLTSKTFADLAKRIYYLSIVADHDMELISVFEERVETRKVLRTHIRGKRDRLEALEEEVRGETRNLELKREERDALVAQLKEKRYYYENLTRQLEEAGRNLEAVIADLEVKREEASRFGGTAFEGRMGTLMWPCDGEVISHFGVETHPQFGTIIKNNGIDIKTLPGSRVRAVAPGSVSFAGTLSGFGNCIIISHGEGFYSLYGHLESLLVSTGYDVGEGEAIGFIGETSTPEGAVLHLEIRHGKKPLDPAEWLLK
jgi:septal ring factor EnvC (AmiA/AmiB activator)